MPDGISAIDTPEESPFEIPSDKRRLVKWANDLIEICRTSVGSRASLCRQLNSIIETGRLDGTRARINKLHSHCDRLAAHLFSPTHLRFTVDFENHYPQNILAQAEVAARILDRDWERNNTDMTFGQGVRKSLDFGCAILKQWVEEQSDGPVYQRSLVMPWQFGVYREDINELSRQPAFVETTVMTLPEVWRRIWYLPDAKKLFERIKANGQKGSGSDEFNSFFHNVLSTSTLNTTGVGAGAGQMPGGIVQMNSDPQYSIIGPQIGADVVKMHELWVWDKTDWCTIQLIEPDIIVFPKFKKGNLLIGGAHDTGLHPYTKIQPNEQHGYFWGRSEVMDLIQLQTWLATTADDVHRLLGLQMDKILAFTGFDGLTDETYDQMRGAGYFNGPMGANVTDLTPSMPPQSLEMLQMMMKLIDNIGGFDNILSGQGEQGVRAGVHADTLLKTASPRLRDRALLVERQCGAAADLRLSLMEAKEGQQYWTDGANAEKIEETSFLLSDLPGDRRVLVDSHSSSPIFMDDQTQTTAFGFKAGLIDGESTIDMLHSIPAGQKDVIKQRYRQRQESQQETIKWLRENDPAAFAKMLGRGK